MGHLGTQNKTSAMSNGTMKYYMFTEPDIVTCTSTWIIHTEI